jgi:hypothetical protein
VGREDSNSGSSVALVEVSPWSLVGHVGGQSIQVVAQSGDPTRDATNDV